MDDFINKLSLPIIIFILIFIGGLLLVIILPGSKSINTISINIAIDLKSITIVISTSERNNALPHQQP
jgi:hypothetical protein